MNARVAALTALCLTTFGAAAQAQRSSAAESPWSATIEVGPVWHHDASHTAFHDDSNAPTVAGLAFGRDLAHLGPLLTLGVEAAWTNEGSTARVRNAFTTSLYTNRLHGGLIARVELWRYLTPYVRLTAGAAHLDARVNGSSGDALTTTAWTPQGSLGAGLLLTSGQWFRGLGWPRGKLAIGVEGGYQYTLPTQLEVAVPAPASETAAADRLPGQSVNLGTLNPSAAYLRITFNVRF
jgi:hypothetical protein